MFTSTSFKATAAPCGRIEAGESYEDRDEEALVTEEVDYACGCRTIRHEYHDGSVSQRIVRHDGDRARRRARLRRIARRRRAAPLDTRRRTPDAPITSPLVPGSSCRDAVLTTSCWWAAAAPACARPSPSPKTNPRLRIAVVSKVYPMRSHTVSAEGGAAGVIRSRRQPRRARLRHHLRRRLAVRSGRRRGVRQGGARRSCCGSSTGAARGAASRTAASPCGRSAA